jgi:hypothetical protein
MEVVVSPPQELKKLVAAVTRTLQAKRPACKREGNVDSQLMKACALNDQERSGNELRGPRWRPQSLPKDISRPLAHIGAGSSIGISYGV